ncbi:MAG: hypothetical protein ACKVH4_02180 [Flavobacteriales bacterium]|nr:hypothetical protein [Flavobacteriaceae bacterium]
MNYKKQSINTLIESCKKKNQEDALDTVQEGFINAFEKLDQYN